MPTGQYRSIEASEASLRNNEDLRYSDKHLSEK